MNENRIMRKIMGMPACLRAIATRPMVRTARNSKVQPYPGVCTRSFALWRKAY